MSIRNGVTGRSGGHPKSDRLNVSGEQCAAFLRGMARLLVMAAREVDNQQTLPGPYVHREQDIIEGEWR